MSVKYGPIICDPTSEEAKALVGKKVIGSNSFREVSVGDSSYYTLERFIMGRRPFLLVNDKTKSNLAVTFIREVIEEEPQYRPYKDTEEMVEDFKKRFCSHTTIPQYSMPFIWIENRNVRYRFLVSTFGSDAVHVEGSEVYSWLNMENLFRYMNYLDGSPVGKEVEE